MKRALVVVVALCARAAHASPEEAAAEVERAKTAYDGGDFATAADAYHKAFDLDAKSEYLFGWAQAVRRGGDCPAALELYQKLLAMPLDEIDAAATRQSMALCEPPKPPPSKPIEPPPPAPIVVDDGPWYRDWRGDVLAGGASVAIGLGTWATVQSVFDERGARDADTYGEHQRLGDRATILRLVGISAIGFGVVSGSVGAYRYATRQRMRTLSAWVGGRGGGLALGGTW